MLLLKYVISDIHDLIFLSTLYKSLLFKLSSLCNKIIQLIVVNTINRKNYWTIISHECQSHAAS